MAEIIDLSGINEEELLAKYHQNIDHIRAEGLAEPSIKQQISIYPTLDRLVDASINDELQRASGMMGNAGVNAVTRQLVAVVVALIECGDSSTPSAQPHT